MYAKVDGEVQVFRELKYKNVKPLYLIDEYGNVYSKYKKGYLKSKKDKDGYLSLSLAGIDKTVYVRVATLVAYNFIGKPPKNMKDPTIDHIDNNIVNNYFKNLRWMERGMNSSIRVNKGLGEKNSEARLTNQNVIEICELLAEDKLTLKEIGEKYNVSKSTISNIKRKVRWRHITNNYIFPKVNVIRAKNGRFSKVGSTGK